MGKEGPLSLYLGVHALSLLIFNYFYFRDIVYFHVKGKDYIGPRFEICISSDQPIYEKKNI